LEAAIRELVRRARAAYGPTNSPELLDIQSDGVRCVLLRVPVDRGERDPTILSPREWEIARMVARGYANKTIAAVLDISTWTVGTYLRRIFAKLGVGTRAAMVARLKPDIVPVDPTASA
jgi:DNA-binding CsgD family transcriptional regulator